MILCAVTPFLTGRSSITFWRRQWTMWIIHRNFLQSFGGTLGSKGRGDWLRQTLWSFCVSQRGCVLLLRNGNVYIKYTYLRLLNIRCQNRSVLLSLCSCLKWKCKERRCEGSRAQRGAIGEAPSSDAGSPLTLRFCICRPRKATAFQPWETRALTVNWWRRLSAKIGLGFFFCTLLFLFTFWYTELLLM